MMTTRQAWFCPSCQKYHAPHVETCPGGTGGIDPWGVRLMPTFVPTHLRPTPGLPPVYTLGPQVCGCASPVCRERGCQAARAVGPNIALTSAATWHPGAPTAAAGLQ